jgi:hypothetical protein
MSFFSGIGDWLGGAWDTAKKGVSGAWDAIKQPLSSLLPMAGTAVGGYFGGPGGMALGKGFGDMASNLVRGPTKEVQSRFNAAIPSRFSNGMTIGGAIPEMARYGGQQVGNMLDRVIPGGYGGDASRWAGNQGANWLQNNVSSRVPENISSTPVANMFNKGAQWVGNQAKSAGRGFDNMMYPPEPIGLHAMDHAMGYAMGGPVMGDGQIPDSRYFTQPNQPPFYQQGGSSY